MVFEEFGSLLAQICSRSLVALDRPLVWTIIANPRAGGFTIRSPQYFCYCFHGEGLLICLRFALLQSYQIPSLFSFTN